MLMRKNGLVLSSPSLGLPLHLDNNGSASLYLSHGQLSAPDTLCLHSSAGGTQPLWMRPRCVLLPWPRAESVRKCGTGTHKAEPTFCGLQFSCFRYCHLTQE